MKKLFIFYSKGFLLRDYLHETVMHIAGENVDSITVLGDYHLHVDSLCNDKISYSKIEDDRNVKYKIRDALKSVTHAIIFWDGREGDWLLYEILLRKIPNRIIAVKVTNVVNKDVTEKFDIYIGRGTPWGNPFPIGEDGLDREQVIEKFRIYFENEILSDEKKRKDILSLKGKTLGCHCKPHACHGDIIVNYLNSIPD